MNKNFNDTVNSFVSMNYNNNNYKMHDNDFIRALKHNDNFTHTTNGAVAKKSTGAKVYDMFATGAAYRSRSEDDCILLFKEAYMENPKYALKCLAYLRDIESQGQGERRFFRVVLKWLALYDVKAVKRNLEKLVKDNYCRWDDIFVLFDTPAEDCAMNLIREQLLEDINAYNAGANRSVSLAAKWMPSINASSAKTKANGRRIARTLGLTERQYRKMLAKLRERINVVERLMSQNRWDEIEFDKLPSRAGLIYRNCFKNKGLIAEKYRKFAQDTAKTVNAGKLYPYDIVSKAIDLMGAGYRWSSKYVNYDDTERLMLNKYWANLSNVFPDGENFNAMVVCDTSASMLHGASNTASPMEIAVSLAMYAAERANGPFKNHYISFSRNARLVEVAGTDFCDKVKRIVNSNVCENTNLESVFNLVLSTAFQYNLKPSAMPKTLIVISDQQVDACAGIRNNTKTFMTTIRRKWNSVCASHNKRYEFPNIVFWNVNASNTSFLDDNRSGVTFVSGASPALFNQVVTGMTGIDLMFKVLDSERYQPIE